MTSRFASRLASLCLASAALTGVSVAAAEPEPEDPPRLPGPWFASPVARLSFAGVEERLQDDTDGSAATPPRSVLSRVEVTGQLGAVGGGHAGLLAGAMALSHQGQLAYGGAFEFSGLLATRLGVAATAGWSRRSEGGFGLALLGVLGAHHYMNVGRAILSSDPGVAASLPFAGVRGRISYVLGTSGTRFQLGATAAFDHDLMTVKRSSTYEETGLVLTASDQPTRTTTEHTIGYSTVALMLDAGVLFE